MLALFGFFTCVALDAPFWAYLVGFLCLFDSSGCKCKKEVKNESGV